MSAPKSSSNNDESTSSTLALHHTGTTFLQVVLHSAGTCKTPKGQAKKKKTEEAKGEDRKPN